MGDPSGIGPEVLAAALREPAVRAALLPVVFGDASIGPRLPGFARVRGGVREPPLHPTLCAVTALPAAQRRPGRPGRAGGAAQLAYVQEAIRAAASGAVQALCTAPVSKEQISRAGVPFMGHTELLAEAFGCDVLMLMDGPRLKVALATNHVPIAQLPKLLRKKTLVAQLRLLSDELARVRGKKPRLAVCGLNPHAGEGGLLGREEVRVIAPAIAAARAAGVDCHGPFAADGLFAKAANAAQFEFDAVLAMFHDQGLVATKTLDFVRTVNVTLGLPVPRTSPDHGVAYDLAGKGRADPEPMIHALLKAAQLAR